MWTFSNNWIFCVEHPPIVRSIFFPTTGVGIMCYLYSLMRANYTSDHNSFFSFHSLCVLHFFYALHFYLILITIFSYEVQVILECTGINIQSDVNEWVRWMISINFNSALHNFFFFFIDRSNFNQHLLIVIKCVQHDG